MVLGETIRILISAALSFFIALLITPLWFRFLEKYHFRKKIRDSKGAPIFAKLHQGKEGTLTGGGVIIWLTVVILALIFWLLNRIADGFFKYLNFVNRAETYLPLAALIVAAVLGFIDDWRGTIDSNKGFKVRYKLIIYTILAALGAFWFYFRLGWDVINIPFLGNFNIGFWYIPIFMFVIAASAFSANETDGLDGLLGGVSLFSFLALTLVAFSLRRYDLAVFSSAIIGSLLAFLWFNIYPAKFFMGDTGSMSLGITLGVITMLTNTVLFLPFFAVILVIESLSVIIQVTSKKLFKKKIFISTPIHHHLEALGWPESQITMRFWIVSAVFTALGLALFYLNRFL